MAKKAGKLYVVATPIGNLGDITTRACEVLSSVDLILVEDTRHTGQLLKHLAIEQTMQAYHDHNEREMTPRLIERLEKGESMALVSDAGTPLVRDPGFHLVKAAQESGLDLIPIPGACALISALSVAGLPADRFVFEGFLPARSSHRKRNLEHLSRDCRTLALYEAPHRVLDTLKDIVEVLGPDRLIVIAREITKRFEEIVSGTAQELHETFADRNGLDRCRGEFVILIAGYESPAEATDGGLSDQELHVLECLVEELPVKQAASIAAKITNRNKNLFYERAIELKK